MQRYKPHSRLTLGTFSDKGVDTTRVEVLPETSTGAAFITVTPDGENAIAVAPGANLHLTPEDVDAASEDIRRARLLR